MLADLENALMCKCKDKCGKVLINCTCDTSNKTRADFQKLLDSGLTVQQIVQQQVALHGETILSAPTKIGFNLTAWVTPFAAILVGGYGVRRILNAWIRGKKAGTPASGEKSPDPQEPISSNYSRRLQEELDKLEI